MMDSLRKRLLTGIIGGMILLLTIFSLLLYVVIKSTLTEQFDTTLASVIQVLAASVEMDGNEIELEFEVEQIPEFQNAENPIYYQLWGADGTVIAKSPLLGTHNLIHFESSLKTFVFRILRDINGRPQRAVGLKFIPRLADHDEEDSHQATNEQVFSMVVSRDASNLYGQLRFLRRLLLIASAAVITLSLLIAAIVVRQGLRPLNFIAAEIAAIRTDNLTTRIGARHVPTEVVPIKNRLNELLSRLEASFNKERQFNADVAHELRTPLAGIRSTIEVSLTRTRDTAEYKEALSGCLEITKDMQKMVDSLLILARTDNHQIISNTERIHIVKLMDSCWQQFLDKALNRRLIFENRIPTEITCDSEPEFLSMVFMNLLDNAVEYADEGGQIRTTACNKDGSVEIVISNTGCQLTPEQVSKVFDCFWRSDSSRSDTGTHCGLGLALVQRLITALGGHVVAEMQPGGIFIVRVTLPVILQK